MRRALPVRDYRHRALRVHSDRAAAGAGPDAPDRYKSGVPALGSTDAKAFLDAERQVPGLRADAAPVSPPYRDEEEPPDAPAAVLQDSVWPADAAAAKGKLTAARWDRPGEAAAAGAARECWARPDAERREPSEELSERHPSPEASAGADPTRSGPASAAVAPDVPELPEL